jgi:hypothetical protein
LMVVCCCAWRSCSMISPAVRSPFRPMVPEQATTHPRHWPSPTDHLCQRTAHLFLRQRWGCSIISPDVRSSTWCNLTLMVAFYLAYGL